MSDPVYGPIHDTSRLTLMERLDCLPNVVVSLDPSCSVLDCKLPRDESYREPAGGYFCWCSLHGRLYEAEKRLRVKWHRVIQEAHRAIGEVYR